MRAPRKVPSFDFVGVAGVEKGDGSALVEPFLQFSSAKPLGRGNGRGRFHRHRKAMISFLIFTSIRLNG